jgi:hypothetical protein
MSNIAPKPTVIPSEGTGDRAVIPIPAVTEGPQMIRGLFGLKNMSLLRTAPSKESILKPG